MNNQIKKYEKSPHQQKYYEELINEGFDQIYSDILSNRFFSPEDHFNNYSSPLLSFDLLSDIEKAVDLLYFSIENKEKITIVADYDADGATACATMLRGLTFFGANVDFFVPNRFKHGYGLSVDVVKEVIANNAPNLIVTVDNGISSFDGVKYSKDNNVKVLVTDHHIAPAILPEADAIINPNKPNCAFPSKNLAGCGVAFYVLMALKSFYKSIGNPKGDLPIAGLIDIVAMGTIADVVKLDLNNRIIVNLGLKLIREGKSHSGIKSLIEVSKKVDKHLTSSDISFCLAPKINAAGRLDDMSLGIKLLSSDEKDFTDSISKDLNELNLSRKQIELEMLDEADFNINAKGNFILSYSDTFHEGVIGIVASRLKEKYNLPSIVFSGTEDPDIVKGSGRSISGINLRDAIDYVHKKSSDIIIKFGGHAMAAGLSIYKNKLDIFEQLFNEAISSLNLTDDFFNKITYFDSEILISQIDYNLLGFIEKQPWGQNNAVPTFLSNVLIFNQQLLQDKHLKFTAVENNTYIDAIWFNHAEYLHQSNMNLVYQISVNRFRDTEKPQLLIINAF